MSASEKHAEFLRDVTKLIKDFNDANSDLYINNIDIHTGMTGDNRKVFLGVLVDIYAQPREIKILPLQQY
jgi:hypothetical protein